MKMLQAIQIAKANKWFNVNLISRYLSFKFSIVTFYWLIDACLFEHIVN